MPCIFFELELVWSTISKALENKLKKEYGKNSAVPYKIMNKMGVMKGNKETAKGKAMDKKSMADRMNSLIK